MAKTHTVTKDDQPRRTIARARAALATAGVFPMEVQWRNPAPSLHSVLIQDIDFPVASNGKGITREYALASAYAEMLERLQNGILVRPAFANKANHLTLLPDEVLRPLSAIEAAWPNLMLHLLPSPPSREERGRLEQGTVCAPFFSFKNKDVVELPLALINGACASNGMCAGNTAREALTQGLCEIAERYAMKVVMGTGGMTVPTIPPEVVSTLTSQTMAAELAERGLSVIVKDCSLGGVLPVVAAIVMDRSRGLYSVAFGSSPTLATAFERCLTEVFQGRTLDEGTARPMTFNDARDADRMERFAQFRTGKGQFPLRFFRDGGCSHHKESFIHEESTTQERFDHVLQAIMRMSGNVFIRDVSFLGFPAYRIYAPGVTEMVDPGIDFPFMDQATADAERIVLTNIGDATTEQVGTYADYLERAMRLPGFAFDAHNATPWRITKYHLDAASPAMQPDSIEEFILTLRIRQGHPSHILSALRRLCEQQGGDPSPLATCAMEVLRRMEASPGVPDVARIVRDLSAYFDENVVWEAIHAVTDPASALGDMPYPACGECETCPARGHCRYPQWARIHAAMRHAAASTAIRQEDLAHVCH